MCFTISVFQFVYLSRRYIKPTTHRENDDRISADPNILLNISRVAG